MATTTASPNMNLTIGIPGVEPGPDWAVDLVNMRDTLDVHDHSPGKGVKITPSGLNINAALDFATFGATTLGLARFVSLSGTLSSGVDKNEVYVVSGNLYFNNGSGTPVQITNGAAIFAGALSPNTWGITSIAGSPTISGAASYVVLLVDTSAPRVITLPIGSTAGIGRYYKIKDSTGSCATNNITLQLQGTDTWEGGTTTKTLTSTFDEWTVWTDGATPAAKWYISRSGAEVNGASVPAAGALTPGNVLKVSGTSALTYGQLDLANAASTTGVLPAPQLGAATTVQSGAVQLTHDLAGTATAPLVVGVTATSGNPFTLGSAGPSLISLGAGDVQWPTASATPKFGILPRVSAGTPTRIKFYGQDAATGGAAGAGGGIDYVTGASFGAAGGDANTSGDHSFKVGPNIVLQAIEVSTSHNFVVIGPNKPTTADLPVATSGNFALFLENTGSAPTAATTSGALLWAASGALGVASSNLSLTAANATLTLSSEFDMVIGGQTLAVTESFPGRINIATVAPSGLGVTASVGALGLTSGDAVNITSTLATTVTSSADINLVGASGTISISSPTSGHVIGLGGKPSGADMPANTGNEVVWLQFAATEPTVASATGVTVYASNRGASGTGFGFAVKGAASANHRVVLTGEKIGSAFAGALTPPVNVDSYLPIIIDGTEFRIPLYRSS